MSSDETGCALSIDNATMTDPWYRVRRVDSLDGLDDIVRRSCNLLCGVGELGPERRVNREGRPRKEVPFRQATIHIPQSRE